MQLYIADTFQSSLLKLTNQEQKAVKQTAFDLQMNPDSPGLRYHKLDRLRDPRFWSLSVNMDIRIIVHRMDAQVLMAYVDHHDAAYRWAQNRKIEVHPSTGAAQIVEVVETQEEIAPTAEPTLGAKLPSVFDGVEDAAMLATGLPVDYLKTARSATEETLFDVLEGFPAEAAEGLFELLYGPSTPQAPEVPAEPVSTEQAFQHPDAQRRFRILTNKEELEQALDYPWEKWTVFLHPSQRALVQKDYNGPARVTGSAGTGKTIVALHRAVWLAKENPEASILLTTFSKTLARSLRLKLARLTPATGAIARQISVLAMDEVLLHAGREALPHPNFATRTNIDYYVREAMKAYEYGKQKSGFVLSEFLDVVDAWQLNDEDAYADITRLGRRTPLNKAQRSDLWLLFQHVRDQLKRRNLLTRADAYSLVADKTKTTFDHIIVDEAQDITVPQLRFLARLANGADKNALFFAGDVGQRIFQVPFSWASLGVEIRGRSSRLKVNYRTSHQIRQQADRLIPDEIEDADGIREAQGGTVSVFNGPKPTVTFFEGAEEETAAVTDWLSKLLADGVQPEEIGVFVRSDDQFGRAKKAVRGTNAPFDLLSETEVEAANAIAIGTMHLAKGLEFRAVAVLACDDDVIPLQSRLQTLGDQGDLDEVYASERQLLYVACTRAREFLWVSGVEPESEFLEDMA